MDCEDCGKRAVALPRDYSWGAWLNMGHDWDGNLPVCMCGRCGGLMKPSRGRLDVDMITIDG